jgi:methenyltetrahydrofolate cyclohydrolase
VSERTPAPGAGAVAAVVAGLAAALAEMAARYAEDEAAVASATTLRTRALPLAAADGEAYGAVLATTGEERRAALSRASDVPLAVAETAAETAALAARLAAEGRASLHGDAAAGAVLAAAAARAAANLVAINLGPEKDDDRVGRAAALASAAAASAEQALSSRR